MICICGAPGYIGNDGVTTWLRSWIWVKPPRAVGLASGPAAGVATWCAAALGAKAARPSADAAPADPSRPRNRRRVTASCTFAMISGEHMGDPPSLRDVGPARVDVDRVDGLTGGDHQPVALGTTEDEIGGRLRQADVADALALWGEDVHPVVAIADPAARGPDVAVDVGAHRIRSDLLPVHHDVGEDPAIIQGGLVDHVEDLDVTRARAGVDDVELLVVRGEAQAVRCLELVGDARNLPVRVDAVDSVGQLGLAGIALVAADGE